MKRLRAWRLGSKTATQQLQSVVRPAACDASVQSNESPSSRSTLPSPCGASASDTSLPSVAAGTCSSLANTSDTLVEPATTPRTPTITARDDELCAQFRSDFHLQCAQHAEKFSVLLQELERGHRQRNRQFCKMYLATGQAFDTAQRGRRQEWLKLQEALERSALDMRNSLLARARDQKEEHDRQASNNLQACETFANCLLERRKEAGHQVEEMVRSLLVSFTAERNDRPTPEVNACYRPSFQMLDALGLQLADITPPFPEPPPVPERASSLEIVPRATSLPPIYEEPHSFDVETLMPIKWEHLEGSAPSTHTPVDDLNGQELMDAFDEHFSQSEGRRRQKWQRLQDFYDACLPKWPERFQELQNSLTSSFILCTQDGTIGRIRNAEETVRISVHALLCDAEASRIDEMKRSWSRQRHSMASCYEDFICSIRMVENTHFATETYPGLPGPPVVQSQRRRRAGRVLILATPSRCSSLDTTTSELALPFSPMSILRRPRTSQPLLTAPSRVQMRSAFEESQRMRDGAFEASISELRAESRMLEAKRVDLFTAALFDWQSEAAAAERERTAEFERRMDATKTEWNAYHAQSLRTADDLVAELGKHFLRAQAMREDAYNDAVREAHALFMRTIGEFPQAYRALLARICDEEERLNEGRAPPAIRIDAQQDGRRM